MIWLTLCVLVTSREWYFEGPLLNNIGVWPTSSAAVFDQAGGLVLTSLDNRIWVLEEGKSPREIDAGDLLIHRIASGADRIFIYATRDRQGTREKEHLLVAFDAHEGTLLKKERVVPNIKNLQVEDGHLIVTRNIQRNKPMVTIHDPVSLESQISFFKPTDEIRRDNNFTALWVLRQEDVYAIMTQLSPKLYFAVGERIALEHDRSDRLPNSLPFLELDLGQKYEQPDPLMLSNKTDFLQDHSRAQIDFFQNWVASSRIVFFGALPNHYVVCFEIPDLIDRVPVGNHLGIQMYDRNFEPVGPLQERFGQVAGIDDGKLFIFYPDGREPHPGEPGALAEHYGFDSIVSQQQLIDAYDRYRKSENRLHHILLETFVPESVSVVE